jgi:hypothetical protein
MRKMETRQRVIDQLRLSLDTVRKEEETMTGKLMKSQRYEAFLVQVVDYLNFDKSKEKYGVQDVLDQHQRLKVEIVNIVDDKETILKLADNEQQRLNQIQQNQQDTYLSLNNQQARLQSKVERLARNEHAGKKKQSKGRQKGPEKTKVDTGLIKASAENIVLRFEAVSTKKKQPCFSEDMSTLEILDLLRDYIIDYKEVVRDFGKG